MTRRAKPARLRIAVTDQAGRRRAALRMPAKDVGRIARAALTAEGVTTGELSVLVTRDPQIRLLNREFRGKDKATNVLAFPPPGGRRSPQDPESGLIGDIAISIDTCAREGEESGAGFRYTFAYYLVHGVLHLLGYDHHRPADAKRMYRRMDEILEGLGEQPE